MIPTIGVMIGFYIAARCVEMVSTAEGGRFPWAVRLVSALALVVAGISMLWIDLGHVNVDSVIPETEASGPDIVPSWGDEPLPPEMGAWIVTTRIDPIDESETVQAWLRSDNSSTLNPQSLAVRCRSGRLEVFIVWGEYIGNDRPDVTLQWGQAEPVVMSWSQSTTGRASFSRDPVRFLGALLPSDTLMARVETHEGQQVRAVFSLAGAENAVEEVRAACENRSAFRQSL